MSIVHLGLCVWHNHIIVEVAICRMYCRLSSETRQVVIPDQVSIGAAAVPQHFLEKQHNCVHMLTVGPVHRGTPVELLACPIRQQQQCCIMPRSRQAFMLHWSTSPQHQGVLDVRAIFHLQRHCCLADWLACSRASAAPVATPGSPNGTDLFLRDGGRPLQHVCFYL